VNVTSAADNVDFNITVTTSNGSGWLSVTPQTGTTPARLNIGANPIGLSPGNYTGVVSVNSSAAGNSPQRINVAFTVSAISAPALTAFVNAASFQPGPAAPGMIFTIGGTAMGPATLTTLQLTPDRKVSTRLAETRILFDGIEAPLIYVSATQSSGVVPYAMTGRSMAKVQVEYRGVVSNTLDLRVADSFPGIFTANAQGNGQGAVLNQDGTVNSSSNPAARGSIVVVYATGEGQTRPAGEDGTVAGVPLKLPALPVTARIGGQPAVVEYAGSAPGLVSGAFQLNLRIGENVTPGPNLPVEFAVGTAASQFGVTVAVR
jgi:uncharacterized protein (TIGR03437 family)